MKSNKLIKLEWDELSAYSFDSGIIYYKLWSKKEFKIDVMYFDHEENDL